MSKYRQNGLTNQETFSKASQQLAKLTEKERCKDNPNLDLVAAYAAIGQCLCHFALLVKGPVALTISLTLGNKGKGDNMVMMLGNEDLMEPNNNFLIQRIQQEIIQEMHEGGNQ